MLDTGVDPAGIVESGLLAPPDHGVS